MEEASAQKGVGQLLLVVARDDDDRAMPRFDEFASLIDVELHAVDLAQQIIREFDIRLVDLVDQQDRLHIGIEGLPQLAAYDVVSNIGHFRITQLGITQT